MIKNRFFCLINKIIFKKNTNEREIVILALRKAGEKLATEERYDLERDLDQRIEKDKSKRFCPKSKNAKKIFQQSSGEKDENKSK